MGGLGIVGAAEAAGFLRIRGADAGRILTRGFGRLTGDALRVCGVRRRFLRGGADRLGRLAALRTSGFAFERLRIALRAARSARRACFAAFFACLNAFLAIFHRASSFRVSLRAAASSFLAPSVRASSSFSLWGDAGE